MKTNKQKENKIIKETLIFLEKAPYSERKSYIKDFCGDGVEINGYIFEKDVWCWLVWKPTDIGNNPEYKGEPIVKVIPRNINLDNIEAVLDAQPWTYI